MRAQIEELERRLGMNSQNSSKPPSSDPLHIRTPPSEETSEPKKREVRYGHKPYQKNLLPPEQVTKRIELEPTIYPSCGGTHFSAWDKTPLRDQVIDVPPIQPEVTEFVRPVRACASYGAYVHAFLSEARVLPDLRSERKVGRDWPRVVGVDRNDLRVVSPRSGGNDVAREVSESDVVGPRTGGVASCARGYTGLLAGKCRAILYHRDHLWTFVDHSEVESTHNPAERMLRPAVLDERRAWGLRASGARGMWNGRPGAHRECDMPIARPKRYRIPARSLPVLSTGPPHPPAYIE